MKKLLQKGRMNWRPAKSYDRLRTPQSIFKRFAEFDVALGHLGRHVTMLEE
jgi:hypothetical protein